MYLSWKGIEAIVKELNSQHSLTCCGKAWSNQSVCYVLRNIAYTGNLILQQTFREDHLTKSKLKNEGQLPQYHVADAHEAIISMAEYEAVQEEIRKRAEKYTHPGSKKSTYPYSGMITCGHCGKHYRRKMTHGGPVWICPTYNTSGPSVCPSKAIPERILEEIDINNLSAICATDDNMLVLQWADGSETEKHWQDRSRAESWTTEKRLDASQRAKERNMNHA